MRLALLVPVMLMLSSGLAAAAPAADPDQKAAATEAQMTDEERFHMLHSHLPIHIDPSKPAQLNKGEPITAGHVNPIERLGIPMIAESDASLGVSNPFGLRDGDVATALPSSMSLAATFNPELAYQSGAMIASEARAKGFNVLLGPGVNLARDPRNGRNFEYLGEDPLLAGTLAGETARGIQSRGVVATIKHFALNDQETLRRTLDARIDEAAFRESDLLAFELGIERGQPGALMCAYNQVGGAYACGNDFLLNKVLKGDWGYKGWVMSDWGAVHDVGYFNAGLDQESADETDKHPYFEGPLKAEYEDGNISKARVSDAVRRILRSIYAVGADQPVEHKPIDYDADAKVARASSSEGIVLLKNDNALPLAKSDKSIIVIGGYAGSGVMSGGGSSQVIPVGGAAAVIPIQLHWIVHKPIGEMLMPSAPYSALQNRLAGVKLTWDAGNDVPSAAARAARADIAVVFATKWETEGRDSGDLSLTEGQDRLIEAVAKANPNTIVVLETGNPVLMPWLDSVRAVVEAWYPGQKGGEAIADVLTGAVNPSGRLPITFPASEAQNPRGPLSGLGEEDGSVIKNQQDVNEVVEYLEGADVGYRGYAVRGIHPLFAFGYGLSYTRFEHGPLKLHGGETVKASFSVRNIGERAGQEVAQLYLVDAAGKPVRRLAGFDKLDLKPGESGKVELSVEPRLLANWDEAQHGWLVKAGNYSFAVGNSAEDLGPVATVELKERRLKP